LPLPARCTAGDRITDPLSHREYEYGQIWELVLPDTGVGLASAD